MVRETLIESRVIRYTLTYKNVKNINLRIKADGSVYVSANRRVSEDVVEGFVRSKAKFIFGALEKSAKYEEKAPVQYYGEDEVCRLIEGLCKEIYPAFECRGIKYPHIKCKKMVSQWGNCYPRKGVLTFNINLMYAPRECIEYVVVHEFAHFLQQNHSAAFYAEIEKIIPDWKVRRHKLKEISVR